MSRSKPIIGVTPLWDAGRYSVWMLPEYLDGIRAAGGVPVVLPLAADDTDVEALADAFDGFLFTGGPDVAPALYGAEDQVGLQGLCPERDALESALFQAVMRTDKPILGICRGIQFINAALGGTLWQDLPSQHPSEVIHRQPKPFNTPIHPVSLSGPIRTLLGKDMLMVNSHHHQAVKDLAPGLVPMAVAPDGIVEAVELVSATRFLWAVQWHPELLFDKDPDSLALFQHFIAQAKK